MVAASTCQCFCQGHLVCVIVWPIALPQYRYNPLSFFSANAKYLAKQHTYILGISKALFLLTCCVSFAFFLKPTSYSNKSDLLFSFERVLLLSTAWPR